MRILYITDGGSGGVSSHVRCLTQCLKGIAEVMVCITYRTDALKTMLEADGTSYVCCNCKSGHDIELIFRTAKIIREFNPDVIHFHTISLFAALYVKVVRKLGGLKGVRVFCSIHTPSNINPGRPRRILNWSVEPCYWLPVSGANWRNFKTCYPQAHGEVFFNPVKIDGRDTECGTDFKSDRQAGGFVAGMVGRNADQKDWPAFCKVVEVTGNTRAIYWGVGVSEDEAKAFGTGARAIEWQGLQINGREWIGKMDLFVMTSKHEELPTTVLECFQERTPICGFIPKGGMSDILALSNGALKEVFVAERDCERLAAIVNRLILDADLRRRVVEDGWQILTQHFDAEKNVKNRLLKLYAGEA